LTNFYGQINDFRFGHKALPENKRDEFVIKRSGVPVAVAACEKSGISNTHKNAAKIHIRKKILGMSAL
jgi:hypothetical protein